MNKNTTIAFILILATVAFFTSPVYQKYYITKVLKRPFSERAIVKKESAISKENETQRVQIDSKAEASAHKKDLFLEQKTEKKKFEKWDTVWIETEKIIAGISEKGARIVSLQMKKYPLERNNKKATNAGELVELVEKESEGGACLMINNSSFDGKIFRTKGKDSANKRYYVKKGEQKTLSFITDESDSNKTEKNYTFKGEEYIIGLLIKNDFLRNSIITISWPAGIIESEKKTGIYQIEQRAAHFADNRFVEHIKTGKPLKEEKSGFYKWVGVTSKYFFEAIVADTIRDADIKIIAFDDNKIIDKNGKKSRSKSINYSLSYKYNVQGNQASCWFYTGPAKFDELKQYNLLFTKVIFPVFPWGILGFVPLWADSWFPPIAEFVLWLLLILFKITKDYGISIILLTILTRLVTFPLAQSSMKKMSRMKDIQPKVNALRQKYKNNPNKLNQEMMALYKKEGVNPLDPGCLPMLLQMPVFFALFVVLQKAIELRGATTLLIPWIKDLSLPESLISFEQILPNGIPLYGTSFAILPVIMAVLTYFQNKMTIKDPNQKMMIYFMPIFMLVLFNNFASGLVLYWTGSSALALIQQYYFEKYGKRSFFKTRNHSPTFKQ